MHTMLIYFKILYNSLLVQFQCKTIRLTALDSKFHILKNHRYKNHTLLPQQNSQSTSWTKYPGHGKLLDYWFGVFLGLVLCYRYYYPGIIGTASFLVIVTAARGLLIGYLAKKKRGQLTPGGSQMELLLVCFHRLAVPYDSQCSRNKITVVLTASN